MNNENRGPNAGAALEEPKPENLMHAPGSSCAGLGWSSTCTECLSSILHGFAARLGYLAKHAELWTAPEMRPAPSDLEVLLTGGRRGPALPKPEVVEDTARAVVEIVRELKRRDTEFREQVRVYRAAVDAAERIAGRDPRVN